MRVRAKKRLGQNFLVDGRVSEKIVDALDPSAGEPIIEIGPGEGALTGLLVERGAQVIAIEIDPEAADLLDRRFGEKIDLIRGDFLAFDLEETLRERGIERVRVIGNLPYYITSPILFRLVDLRRSIAEAIIMTQKEVAARITAPVRTKDRGIVSVVIQTVAEARRLFTVAPGSFRPVPSVQSAVCLLRFHERTSIDDFEADHRRFVRAAFSKRRKTINNALAQLIPQADERERIFREAGIDRNRRAEELTVEEFEHLARLFADAPPGQRG